MNKDLTLAWTRDFTLAWAEWWTKYMHPRLVEVFGVGVPNQISYFNGRLLETYRLTEESRAFIDAVVNMDLDSGIFGEEKINRYVEVIEQIRELIRNVNKNKDFKNRIVFEELMKLSKEMYPWYTVSYLLPQEQWASQLTKKYPKESVEILARLIEARKNSEGTIEELIEYWRAVAGVLLSERKFQSKYASFVTFTEIMQMLDHENCLLSREELENRYTGYIFLGDKVYSNISKETFFEKNGFHFVAFSNESTDQEIKGVVSCIGPASITGNVSVILKNSEVGNFKEGSILVTVMTNPFFIPIMKKAKAVITDEGGITCHASIVSRELNIPCITGTKFGTKVLKDGDKVEVDATNGIIKKL